MQELNEQIAHVKHTWTRLNKNDPAFKLFKVSNAESGYNIGLESQHSDPFSVPPGPPPPRTT